MAGVASLLARNGKRYVFTLVTYNTGDLVVQIADDHGAVITAYYARTLLGIADQGTTGLTIYVDRGRRAEHIDHFTLARAIDALAVRRKLKES